MTREGGRDRGLRRDLRLSFGDAAGYGVMAGLAEVYIPAFGLALGMRPALAGLLASLPLLAGGLLQLLAPRAIERVSSLRGWVTTCMVIQAVAFVPLIIVALTSTRAPIVVFAAASLYWAAGMAASAGWNPWMTRLIPPRIRGRFFGRRQGLMQATTLAGLIGAGVILHMVVGSGYRLDVYALLFGIGMIARLTSALMIRKQGERLDPTRRIERTPQRRMRLRSIPPKLRGTPRARLLGYMIAAIAAAAVSGPFLTPYLLHHHAWSYVQYSVFTATIVLAKIVSLPKLGRLIHRVGVQRMLTICAFGIAPLPLMWAASGSFVWLLAVQLYGGVMWAGFELGMLMALFDAETDSERTTLQVAFSALQSIGTAGASLIGAVVLASLGANETAYVWVFVVSTLARLAAVVLLVRELPRMLARLPVAVVMHAWTLAIRPWGGTIVRPIVEGIGRLRPGKRAGQRGPPG